MRYASSDLTLRHPVDADGNKITNKSIEAIKVCGITYSDNEELAYEKKFHNIRWSMFSRYGI